MMYFPSRLQAGERGGDRSQGEEKVWDVVSLPQVLCREVVVPAEGDHAALARVAVELEVAEGQLVQERQERGLVGRADQLGLVSEALGKVGRHFSCAARPAEEV
jgi:hypothetical protein